VQLLWQNLPQELSAMVAKCINPYCSCPFRYLSRGKLFVTEYPPTVSSDVILRARTREHFWLCEECAKSMTVAVRREHGGVTVRIVNLPPDGRRKLDFVPEQVVSPKPKKVINRNLPSFFFEAS
jgi:hypothetical protein